MAIDRAEVGANVAGRVVNLGLYLPQLTKAAGFQVNARVIHAADQFKPEIPSVVFPLVFDPLHPLALWSVTIDFAALPPPVSGKFGTDGQYLYRFELWRNGNLVTKVFLDPFATANGPGLLSAFDIGPVTPFVWTDAAYRTPPLDELIIYELNVAQFYGSFDDVVARLDYLVGLGVNCLELMPITPVKREFDWGYGPIGYFAPEDYLGGVAGLKRLVDAAHARDIAVILDVVYGHADADAFPYSGVYDDANLGTNPMMQVPNTDNFGRGFDHNQQLTRDYCLEANKHWLDEFHIDGFRYDNVPGYYDGNPLQKYGTLVFNTYVYSKGIPRFVDPAGFRRIIQIAEDLDHPRETLRGTFSNGTWQDALLNKAENMAQYGYVDDYFAQLLDPSFGPSPYPSSHDASPAGDQPYPVAPLQYLNTHDHSWLITSFGLEGGDPNDIRFGDRSRYYKLQPFAIALLAAKGIPMLWEGEEFAENYLVPGNGNLRIGFRRGMHWEYFYDEPGNALVRVYRRMGQLRRALPALRSRDFFYNNVESRPQDGLIVFRRKAAGSGGNAAQIALVLLNFSDTSRVVTVPAPAAGTYREMLDRLNRGAAPDFDVVAAAASDLLTFTVPSNYGLVFVTPPPA